jgi:hypothetical protein
LPLLCEQKRLVLQHDESDINYVNGWSNQVDDDPPNGKWGICGALLNRIGDKLTPVLLEDFK